MRKPPPEGKAHCSRCGKVVTLTHKTKTHPNGARLRTHKDAGHRTCYGSPERVESVS